MPDTRFAVHRTILVVDVERFGDPARTNGDRIAVRDGLYRALTAAFETIGVPWAECHNEDRGDGILVIIRAEIAKSVLVESLPSALDAELATHNATHSDAERIRLRMALHAGEIHHDAHGVVGTAVNHAFRLLDAAAFKKALAQSTGVLAVITSAWFYDEVVRHTEFRDEYQPIRVVAKETDTTAWMSVPGAPTRQWGAEPTPVTDQRVAVPQQLPPRRRQFVGRGDELDQLTALLDIPNPDPGMVVITAIAGTAGIGKTTLAIHWAHQIKGLFPDGQLHVNLRGFDPRAQAEPSRVLHGFLEALGVAPAGIPSDLDARVALYRSLVAGRRILIVLDNASSAEHVRPLLPNASSCLVIVTSRNRLDGLVVREGAYRIALDVLPQDDAVELLARRVERGRLTAEPDAADDLVELCARLPLALSIVAALVADQPGLTLRELVQRLRREHDRLDALDLGDTDLNVRAVFSWSYQGLSPAAARLFRLFGVHPGPDIDLHACAALIDSDTSRTAKLVTELTTAHLLEQHRAGRYRCHDLLRAYAAECAETDEPDDERLAALRRAAQYYIQVCPVDQYQVLQRLKIGPATDATSTGSLITTYAEATAWFAAENATLLAMIAATSRHDLHVEAEVLAASCTPFLNRTGQRHERVAAHQAALDAALRNGDRESQIRILRRLGPALSRLGRTSESLQRLDEAAAMLLDEPDDQEEIELHLAYVRPLEKERRYAEALRHAEQAWEIARESGTQHVRANALSDLGRALILAGHITAGLEICDQAQVMFAALGWRDGEAYTLHTQGVAFRQLHDYDRAATCFQRAAEADREIGDRHWEAAMLDSLGDTHQLAGKHDLALDAWRESLAIFEALRLPEAEPVRAKLGSLSTTG